MESQLRYNERLALTGRIGGNMTQLEALKIAHNELSNMMPYDGENDEIFEAASVIEKMIRTREMQLYKKQMKNEPISKADKKRIKGINSMFDNLLDSL